MDCLKCCSQAFSPTKHVAKHVKHSSNSEKDLAPTEPTHNGLDTADIPIKNDQQLPTNKIQGFIDVLKLTLL